jgi:peptide-methionine (R)-S-oxide reductase
MNKIDKSEEDWKKELTEEQYYILREGGTEHAFAGKYNNNKDDGNYYCAGCGNLLFDSKTKYDSKSGWPSFYQPIDKDKVIVQLDKTHRLIREEVLCANCGGHLGHVFNDGPQPTGKRFCMNSAALDFKKRDPR